MHIKSCAWIGSIGHQHHGVLSKGHTTFPKDILHRWILSRLPLIIMNSCLYYYVTAVGDHLPLSQNNNAVCRVWSPSHMQNSLIEHTNIFQLGGWGPSISLLCPVQFFVRHTHAPWVMQVLVIPRPYMSRSSNHSIVPHCTSTQQSTLVKHSFQI